jgi:hypothetical protein
MADIIGSIGQSVLETQAKPIISRIRQSVVAVGIAAVPLPAVALANRRTIVIQADSGNAGVIYIGSSTVTADAAATGGIQLSSKESFIIEVTAGVIIYAIASAAAQNVRVLEAL